MCKESDAKRYLGIPGDYQYRAIHEGIFIQRVWHLNKIYLVEEKFDVASDDTVVEIGCGSGNLLSRMAKKALLVMGVDISDAAIEFARQQCAGLHNVNFQLASVGTMELQEGYYTKVVCQEVIEHLLEDEIDQLMSKSYEALKSGGRLLITTPNYSSLWPVIEYIMDKAELSPPMAGHQHVTKFNMDKLKNCLTSFQFEIIDAGGFNTVAPWVGFLPESLVKGINHLELNHISVLGNLIYVIAQKPP